MPITAGNGLPIAIEVRSGPVHETKLVDEVLDALPADLLPERKLADKAYDSAGLEEHLAEQYKIELIAPVRKANGKRKQDDPGAAIISEHVPGHRGRGMLRALRSSRTLLPRDVSPIRLRARRQTAKLPSRPVTEVSNGSVLEGTELFGPNGVRESSTRRPTRSASLSGVFGAWIDRSLHSLAWLLVGDSVRYHHASSC